MKKLQKVPQEFTGVDEKGQRGGIPNNTSYNYWKHQKQSKSEKWPESPCRSSGSMVGSVAPCPGYTWGWDGLFHRPQSLTEGSQVGSLEEGTEAGAVEGGCLLACATRFLISSGPSLQGPHHSWWTGSSHITFSWENASWHSQRPVWTQSLSCGPLLPGDPACVPS